MVALFFAANIGSYFYLDMLWFDSLGYQSVFFTVIWARLLLGLVGGALFALFLFVNLWVTRGSLRRLPPGVISIAYESFLRTRWLTALMLLFALGVGVLAGISLSTEWMTVQMFLRGGEFGVTEPLFDLDAGFYVFRLPFLELVQGAASLLLGLSLAVVALVYFFAGNITFSAGRIGAHPRARLHLSLLLAGWFVNRAYGYYLSSFNLLYSERGVTFGASYADVHAQLPAIRILIGISLLAALLVLIHHLRRDIRLVYGGVGLLMAGSLLVGTVYPTLIQEFRVRPNEIAYETPYILHNIDLTRQAFALERIIEEPFPAHENLTWSDIGENRASIDNVRLWDWRPLGDVFDQIQGFRVYYDFADVDVDRYWIDGRMQQALLSAREIHYPSVPAQTWVNLHLKYTHGYGVVMAAASDVTPEGLPRLLVQDIPVRPLPDLPIDRPEIYYGERKDIYAIVRTIEEEFSYPLGERNVWTNYEGTGGVGIGNLGLRALLALRYNEHRIMFSDAMTDESRVLMYRNIHERVRKIAPFLSYDSDPYLVVADGRLFWIQDAYSTSTRFPYSEPGPLGWNYVRNSVKIVTDAYNGSVQFYVVEQEPMLDVYQSLFPDLFQPMGQMPEYLLAHIRYPLDLFEMQVDSYLDYHMTDPRVFYNKEDRWERPMQIYAGREVPMEPYYVIMQLPGEAEPEFLLMLPLTPVGRHNMLGWLAARCDPHAYGELILYQMPTERLVMGPAQIEARIDQDAAISQSLTLWGQAGSQVIRGNMIVLPINGALLYVEPVYLQADDARLPELRRVIVAHGPRLTWAETLDEALRILFRADDEVAPPTDPTVPGEPLELGAMVAEAADLYQRAQEALRQGQWALYGSLMDRLGEMIRQIESVVMPIE